MDFSLVIILLVFVAFIFFSNRRRKAATAQLESSLKVGAKAVMRGGITGTIVEVRETTLVVETLPGTKIDFLKAAVGSVNAPSLDEKPAAKTSAAKKATPAKKPAATGKATPAAKKPAAKSKK